MSELRQVGVCSAPMAAQFQHQALSAHGVPLLKYQGKFIVTITRFISPNRAAAEWTHVGMLFNSKQP